MHTKQTKILHKNEKTKRNNIMKKYKNYTDVTGKNKTKHNLNYPYIPAFKIQVLSMSTIKC